MKKILLFACAITLLTSTGCFFPGRGGGWHDRRSADAEPPGAVMAAATPEVVATPVAVTNSAPEVVVKPSPSLVPVTAVIVP